MFYDSIFSFKDGVSSPEFGSMVEEILNTFHQFLSERPLLASGQTGIGSYSLCSASCNFRSICLILIFVNLYAFACISAILYVICIRQHY